MTNATAEIVKCPSCGANNRVSADKVANGMTPVCARCKTPLPTHSAEPFAVTDATFAREVEGSALPVLVDFWAPWCPPCRAIAPVIDKLASEMAGRVKFAKLNVDENPALATRFRADSIPTLLVMKGGKEVDRMVGAQPAAEIRRRLERAL